MGIESKLSTLLAEGPVRLQDYNSRFAPGIDGDAFWGRLFMLATDPKRNLDYRKAASESLALHDPSGEHLLASDYEQQFLVKWDNERVKREFSCIRETGALIYGLSVALGDNGHHDTVLPLFETYAKAFPYETVFMLTSKKSLTRTSMARIIDDILPQIQDLPRYLVRSLGECIENSGLNDSIIKMCLENMVPPEDLYGLCIEEARTMVAYLGDHRFGDYAAKALWAMGEPGYKAVSEAATSGGPSKAKAIRLYYDMGLQRLNPSTS